MIMGLIRNTAYYDREVRKGNWPKCQYLLPPDVRELTLGLYGFGLAGRHLHDIFHNGFGTKVISCDPYISDAVKAQYPDVEFVSFEELITRSDIISIHVVLTPETTHVFNKEVFKRMKNSAILVNCARGGCVDQDDLAWALDNHEIRAAGIDTIEIEPPEKGNPLLGRDNLILTNHMAWYSEDSIVSVKRQVAQNVVDVLTGGTPKYENVVNKDVLK